MNLYTKPYIVKNEKKRLFIIHGICEHSGRYESLAKRFNKEGISVITYDLRGHGRSPGKKGYIKNFEEHIRDFADVERKYRNKNVPQYILAHSLGGLIGHIYMVTGKPKVDGFIVSGAPTDYLSNVKVLRYTGYRWFGFFNIKNNFGNEALSKDKKAEEDYVNDPLVLKKFKVRLAGEMFVKGVKYLNDNIDNHKKPILILHGKDDKIVPVDASERIYNLIPHNKKELIVYEDMYHEIYNEINKEKVFEDVMRWLNAR